MELMRKTMCTVTTALVIPVMYEKIVALKLKIATKIILKFMSIMFIF